MHNHSLCGFPCVCQSERDCGRHKVASNPASARTSSVRSWTQKEANNFLGGIFVSRSIICLAIETPLAKASAENKSLRLESFFYPMASFPPNKKRGLFKELGLVQVWVSTKERMNEDVRQETDLRFDLSWQALFVSLNEKLLRLEGDR